MKFWDIDFETEDGKNHRTLITSDIVTEKDVKEYIEESYDDLGVSNIIIEEGSHYQENKKWYIDYPDYEGF